MTVSRSRLTQLCAAAAAMVTVSSCGQPAPAPPLTSAPTATTAPTTAAPVTTEPVVPTADFSRVSQLVNEAIAV
ncbi:hypothetical protein RM844_33180, partial [Streptomyces sp. DSM 44915]|nr:hypothetical protein [Streptomyces sp. DSM 44915]